MLGKIKKILENTPLDDIKEYYGYFTEDRNDWSREDYILHLLAKLHHTCRHHKRSDICFFRAFNMLAWLEYLEQKYIK